MEDDYVLTDEHMEIVRGILRLFGGSVSALQLDTG